jgi:phage shock protein PspC (stress-responsive transcriptional regulator)
VCGGLAEFFGIRAFWFRLAFLIALIPGGVPGILAYLLFWLVVPGASDYCSL